MISIVILNHNESVLSLECVSSVVNNTKGETYEIIVVDNGSTASELDKLATAIPRNYELISLSRNVFFGEASNIGAEHAKGEFVVFLNNDALVTDAWLDHLLAVFDRAPNAGAVGPKLLYPDGRLQEAGAFLREDGWPFQMGRSGASLPGSYGNSIEVVDYCSAACLLLRRKDFLSVGGFDPIFEPIFFEDCDLALRLRSMGHFSYYCGRAVVYHQENVTARRLWSKQELDNNVKSSHIKFVDRWGSYLRRRILEDSEPDFAASVEWQAEPSACTKKDLVFYASKPLTESERSRKLLQIASEFQNFYDVIIAADEKPSRCRIFSLCRSFGIGLQSFRARKISEIEHSEAVFVVFGADDGQQRRHFHRAVSEHDLASLSQLVEDA